MKLNHKKLVIIGLILILGALLLGGLLGYLGDHPAQTPSDSLVKNSSASSSSKKYNRLIHEKSPYLLQHKDNPVHWFAWGEEAFKVARKENKVIFLSIGYSTCYWCHVMEKDSFERQEVADVLNRDFISIKVDREEHPDVDQIYMDAVVAMTGRGGWPMTVFLTPDLKPFFGGTFFRREPFLQILSKIQSTWKNKPEKILESGQKLAVALAKRNRSQGTKDLNEAVFRRAFELFQKSFDSTYGGFGRAPKFPRSMGLSALLRMYRRTGNDEALLMAAKTLDEMARGGMYDHIGGGFHRYSTDAKWLVPHFEKMLYDNAVLANTYFEAYQLSKNDMYAQVGREILDYVLRDMTGPEGGFYSAEDAGEVGKEGEFYVWKEDEVKNLLTPAEFREFKKVYGVSKAGNFEHGHNILRIPKNVPWEKTKSPLIQSAKKKLFQVREKREHPHKDDKTLTSWNGLMIAAMAKGYQVLGDQKFLDAGRQSAEFVRKNLYQKGKLLRRYREGESKYEGTLNDYAFFIYGLLSLYESDFNIEWLRWAEELQKKQDELFWDKKEGGYFFSVADDPFLLIRKKEMDDGARPSGNAIASLNLQRLHDLTFQEEYQKKAQKVLQAASAGLSRYPPGYAQSLIALDYLLDRSKEIAVVGKIDDEKTKGFRHYLYRAFLPNKVMAIGEPAGFEDKNVPPVLRGKGMRGGKTTIYVCENNICKLPTSDLKKAKELVNDFEKYEL